MDLTVLTSVGVQKKQMLPIDVIPDIDTAETKETKLFNSKRFLIILRFIKINIKNNIVLTNTFAIIRPLFGHYFIVDPVIGK